MIEVVCKLFLHMSSNNGQTEATFAFAAELHFIIAKTDAMIKICKVTK